MKARLSGGEEAVRHRGVKKGGGFTDKSWETPMVVAERVSSNNTPVERGDMACIRREIYDRDDDDVENLMSCNHSTITAISHQWTP